MEGGDPARLCRLTVHEHTHTRTMSQDVHIKIRSCTCNTNNNNVQYNNVQYTCNIKNKSLSLFFILNWENLRLD